MCIFYQKKVNSIDTPEHLAPGLICRLLGKYLKVPDNDRICV